ncbi:hypothetical protein JOF36_005917 [Pseudonocardia parietis]|uniref:Uncharacterized protein n=1 Tax=Pseudonocardia parietis TaxID=570936 RepID=A0ABS4W223_9PSEU|nr:hypothetical protein [Pseudonocardia parietis]
MKVRCVGCEKVKTAQASIDEKRDGRGVGITLRR